MASWDTCARVYTRARLLCLFVFVCIWKWYSPLRSGLSTSLSSVLLTPPDALPAPRLSWVHLSDVFHQTWLTWFSSIREISPSPFCAWFFTSCWRSGNMASEVYLNTFSSYIGFWDICFWVFSWSCLYKSICTNDFFLNCEFNHIYANNVFIIFFINYTRSMGLK